MKTLSVLMPNFNHGRFIATAVEALVGQSRPADQIIIADDASTDDSVSILQSLARRDERIVLIQNRSRKGAVENVNQMLQMASGDYVFGAAADDRVLPGLFQTAMAMLERFPDAGLCSALSRRIDERGNDRGLFRSPIVSYRKRFLPPAAARRLFARGREWIMGNTAIYNRRYLLEEGGFDPALRSYADGFMQMVLTLKHGACFIPEPLACWRQLDASFSAATRDNAAVWEAVLSRAESIAKERYPDLFTEAFIKEWKAHHLLQMVRWGIRNPGGRSTPAKQSKGRPKSGRPAGSGREGMYPSARRAAAGAHQALKILGLRKTAVKGVERLLDGLYGKYLELRRTADRLPG